MKLEYYLRDSCREGWQYIHELSGKMIDCNFDGIQCSNSSSYWSIRVYDANISNYKYFTVLIICNYGNKDKNVQFICCKFLYHTTSSR